MSKPGVLTLLSYAIIISGIAFITSDKVDLVILFLPPLLYTLLAARGKIFWLLIAYLVGSIGVFINSIAFANSGDVLIDLGLLIIRTNAINAFITVSLRLMSIMAAGALFVLLYTPVEIFRGLIREAGFPPTISLPLAYSLRILPVVKRDLNEVIFHRKQRRYRTIIFNPFVLASVVTSLLAVNYERAKWSGINAEIRGVRKIKTSFNYRPKLVDISIKMLLVVQILLIILH
ncbi:MAG: energy-coupling factor transporter transmembrane component T [Desulfurococcaceae archaeon]